MGRGKRKGGDGRKKKKTAPIPDAVRFGPRKEGTGGLPVARQGFVNCLRRGETAGKHCRNVYVEIDHTQQLYMLLCRQRSSLMRGIKPFSSGPPL